MNLDQIAREGKLSRRRFLEITAILGSGALLPSCMKEEIVGPEDDYLGDDSNEDTEDTGDSSPTYNNVTGLWSLSTRDDFGNREFEATMSIDLNFTQTNELLYSSSDIYKVTGTFSDWWLILTRKSDGLNYYAIPGGLGNIINGAINTGASPKRIEFYLASENYSVNGVVKNVYKSMWGNLVMKPTNSSNTGRVTVKGMWDAKRK